MNQTKHHFKIKTLSSALILIGVISFPAFAQNTTDVGTVNISGEGDKLGTGLMIEEDGVKQKSTITKAAIERANPSQNVTEFLKLLPGINSNSYDGTGLWGGTLSYRGFAMNQLGFTVNGVPVNDAANYAAYPMEYADSNNLCEVYVTGSADNEAPHVAASGGNIGLVYCRPDDKRKAKIIQSFGSNNYYQTYARVDSGLFSENFPAKFFLSYSHTQADKPFGYGGAKADHIDAGFDWKISSSTKLETTISSHQMFVNSLFTPTLSQWLTNPSIEYGNKIPTAIASGASSSDFGTGSTAYYGYQNNPFRTLIASAKLESQINDRLTLSASPYFWYGYGAGPGASTLTLPASSSLSSTGITPGGNAYAVVNPYTGTVPSSATTIGGIVPNIQHTDRGGITLFSQYVLDDHKISGGYWLERAVKTQTQPFVPVDAQGNISDAWYRNSSGYALTTSGYPYEKRNYQTQTLSQSVFVSDTYAVNKNLDIIPGLKYLSVNRSFQNYGSAGTGIGLDYETNQLYNSFLPSLGARLKLDSQNQLFANVTTGSKAPASNGPLIGWVFGSSCSTTTSASVDKTTGKVSGCIVPNTATDMEKSTTTEIGHRYFGESFNSTVTIFNVAYNNRIISAYNPATAITQETNIGNSSIWGLEAQAGTKPINGWSAYVSGSYINSKMNDNFNTTTTSNVATTLNTSGNQAPDTPTWMAGASLQYASGPVIANLSAKYTGTRYSTLMNDESLDPFTIVNFSAGYKFPTTSFFQNPTIRLNVANLFDKQYLMLGANYSGSDIKPPTNTAISNGGSPTYYVGAPRFMSISLSSEF